jgi:hypothetical protein
MARSSVSPSLRLIPIAETGEVFSDFAPCVPALGDDGAVVFWAALVSGENAIVSIEDGERRVLARTGDRYADFVSHPTVDCVGGWSAYARLASGERTVVASRDRCGRSTWPDGQPARGHCVSRRRRDRAWRFTNRSDLRTTEVARPGD